MNAKEFKKIVKNIPDDYEIQIWDNEGGEWKDNLEGLLQAVKVLGVGE